MKPTILTTAGALLVLAAVGASTQPPADPHLPMPKGFDFPADETALLKMRDTADVVGMRRHSWQVFAGMTQPAPGGEAIWETWWPQEQTFAKGALPFAAGRQRPRFAPPRQMGPRPGIVAPLAAGQSGLAFVLFNPEGHRYIRENKLHLGETLDALRAQGAADIVDAPREAMSVKTVWWPVAQDQLTPMPVWDDDPSKPIDDGARRPPPHNVGNDSETWKRVVAVDARRTTIPPNETATVRFFDPAAAKPLSAPRIDRPGSRVVALERFYHFKLTASDLQRSGPELNAMFRSTVGRDAREGDFVALVCLHYTTKEIDDWVWSTFWWHDRPDDGPFAADRPKEVTDRWRNYLMDTALSMDTPREGDGTPNAIFNPWLEARFSNGVKSNCMTCHQRAVWPAEDFLPVTRGALKPDDPFFKNKTRLDFLWSVAINN